MIQAMQPCSVVGVAVMRSTPEQPEGGSYQDHPENWMDDDPQHCRDGNDDYGDHYVD
jgi:hypothetical protein